MTGDVIKPVRFRLDRSDAWESADTIHMLDDSGNRWEVTVYPPWDGGGLRIRLNGRPDPGGPYTRMVVLADAANTIIVRPDMDS